MKPPFYDKITQYETGINSLHKAYECLTDSNYDYVTGILIRHNNLGRALITIYDDNKTIISQIPIELYNYYLNYIAKVDSFIPILFKANGRKFYVSVDFEKTGAPVNTTLVVYFRQEIRENVILPAVVNDFQNKKILAASQTSIDDLVRLNSAYTDIKGVLTIDNTTYFDNLTIRDSDKIVVNKLPTAIISYQRELPMRKQFFPFEFPYKAGAELKLEAELTGVSTESFNIIFLLQRKSNVTDFN